MKSKNKKLIKVFKYISIYILIIIISCMLLTIIAAIPKHLIKDHVIEGLETIEKEGLGPMSKWGYNARLDNFSDAVMLNTIYSLDNSNPFISVMNAANIIVPDENMELGNPVVSLRNLIEKEDGYSYNYSRYWHGYIMFFKFLLVFFNYSTIRIILTVIIIVLGLIFLYLIYKKLGKMQSLFTLYTMIMISYQITGMSVQYFSVFFITIIFSIYLLTKEKSITNSNCLFFLIRRNYCNYGFINSSFDNIRNTTYYICLYRAKI